MTRGLAISESGVILAQTQLSNCAVLVPLMPVEGDTDCDQEINIDDLLNVINHWGPCAGCIGELTGDGLIGLPDLLEVILNWGQGGGAH